MSEILHINAETDRLITAIWVTLYIRTGYRTSVMNVAQRYLMEQWALYVVAANAVSSPLHE